MPIQRKRNVRRRRPTLRRRRMMRKTTRNVSDIASLSVSRTLVPGTTNQIYSFDDFKMSDFTRAVQVAIAYQRYRITGIKVTWKPEYDTYAPGPGAVKPYLYYMVDKSGSLPDNVTLEALKQSGARPKAFDEKPISVTFKPAVLTSTEATGGALIGNQYKIFPWLSTRRVPATPGSFVPSDVSHQGLKWYIDVGAGSPLNVNVDVELQFQFIKLMLPSITASASKGLVYAELDDSPDGVVGGAENNLS